MNFPSNILINWDFSHLSRKDYSPLDSIRKEVIRKEKPYLFLSTIHSMQDVLPFTPYRVYNLEELEFQDIYKANCELAVQYLDNPNIENEHSYRNSIRKMTIGEIDNLIKTIKIKTTWKDFLDSYIMQITAFYPYLPEFIIPIDDKNSYLLDKKYSKNWKFLYNLRR